MRKDEETKCWSNFLFAVPADSGLDWFFVCFPFYVCSNKFAQALNNKVRIFSPDKLWYYVCECVKYNNKKASRSRYQLHCALSRLLLLLSSTRRIVVAISNLSLNSCFTRTHTQMLAARTQHCCHLIGHIGITCTTFSGYMHCVIKR